MSDEPSDAHKLIAEVILRHQPNEWGQHDGWWECCCQHGGPLVPWTPEHVAAEVDKALGGLTVEWAPCRDHCGIGTIYEQSMIHPTREGAEKRCRQSYTNPSAWDIRRRFISSGWTVTE